jgi:8-amino-7-oxononanoate synthase
MIIIPSWGFVMYYAPMLHLKSELAALKAQDRYRSLRLSSGVDMTSNDYLCFADYPALKEAAEQFFADGGVVGAGASRLLRGAMDAHMALEAYAADYFASDKALFFSSGFQANYALLTTLPSRHDVIVYDALIHASTRDGIQASAAKRMRAGHNDLASYEAALKKARSSCKGQIWIAVESVYSMDGDIAPLDGLYALAEAYDAALIIDEAHGVGVSGPTGKGASEDLITAKGYSRIITVHTCGKALGVAGGLLCASGDVIDYMINKARGFIYTTAPMPVQAHLVQKALELLASAEGQAARARLRKVSALAHDLLGGHGTHIVPIILGADSVAVRVAQDMQGKDYDIRAIRPPSVPEGTARLRLSLNANLSEQDLTAFADHLSALRKEEAA